MKVLIYGRKSKAQDIPYIKLLLNGLKERKIESLFYGPYYQDLSDQTELSATETISSTEELKKSNIDLLISLGGDGTILKAITLIKDLNVPILGINLGRLGFLANAEKLHIEHSLDLYVAGKYTVQERTMLSLDCNLPMFGNEAFALNDFTIHKRDTSSMILLHCYIDNEILNSYWADGIIVSTPTGSTGYSLSCGGPIITPNCGNFVIAPVAPHNLNARPVVLNDDSTIKIEVEGRAPYFLSTLDSRYEKITSNHIIELKKSSFNTRLIQLENSSFLKTIHKKLMWGVDHRNTI